MNYPFPFFVFFFNDPASPEIYTLSLHDALPIWITVLGLDCERDRRAYQRQIGFLAAGDRGLQARSEEHTSELQSQFHLVCRLLLEKKKEGYTLSVGCWLSHVSDGAIYLVQFRVF